MATNWTLYEKKLKINGDTERERHINTVVNSINNDFSHSPSFQEVKINGVTTGVHILEDSDKADNVKNIVMKPNDALSMGSIIEWDGIKWLCTSAELYSGTYYYGKIQKCIYSLTYNKNGILYEVPIVIESGVRLYSLGQDSTKYINTLSDEIIVYASAIANIEVDDVYKIGKRNYKVRTVQDVLIDGLLVIKMDVTVEGVEEVEHSYIIEILNGAEQKIKYGESLALNVQVKDWGNIVSPTPPLLFESSNGVVCTVNEDGIITATNDSGSATITVKLASDLTVLVSITIIASPATQVNSTYTFVGSVQPDNQLLFNQVKTYTATKFDGSNEVVSTQFLFQVVGDTPSDKYVLTIIDDSHCTLKCLGYPYTVTLRAIDINNSQYIDKPILFKSLM